MPNLGLNLSADPSQAAAVAVNTASIATLTAASRGFRGQGNGGADVTAASYTAVLDDAGKLTTMNRATAQTPTIPPNAGVAFAAFSDVLSWIQIGAGAFTVTPGAGVTLVPPPGKTLVSNGQGAVVSAFRYTADTWYVYGDLIPS